MKIDSSVNLSGGYELPPLQSSNAAASAATPERAGATNDAVSLSVDGAKLQQLEATVQALPDVRQKVEKLQQAVQSGTYNVSDHQIAGAMLTDLLAPPEENG